MARRPGIRPPTEAGSAGKRSSLSVLSLCDLLKAIRRIKRPESLAAIRDPKGESRDVLNATALARAPHEYD